MDQGESEFSRFRLLLIPLQQVIRVLTLSCLAGCFNHLFPHLTALLCPSSLAEALMPRCSSQDIECKSVFFLKGSIIDCYPKNEIIYWQARLLIL